MSRATKKIIVMKSIGILTVAILMAFGSMGQATDQTKTDDMAVAPNQNTILLNQTGEPAVPTASTISFGRVEKSSEAYHYDGEYSRDKCTSYHHMKIAGIVLASVGGGLVLTGSLIMASARQQNYDGNINYYNYNAMMNGGGAMVGLGVAGLGAGIPLAIIGSVKSHQYCGGNSGYYSTLDLHSGPNGSGLALNF
jgi:hypothetical protein